MTTPANPMPPAMLAALVSDLAVAGRWHMIGVHVSIEETSTPGTLPGDPPVVTLTRKVNATLQCAARSLTLIALLSGPDGSTAEEVTVHYLGTPFTATDATLIARIQSAVAPMIAARSAELVAKLTAPIEASP